MKIENIETNKYKLTFEVDSIRFEEGLKFSYNKLKNKINMPGFRKGKVPRKVIEMQFGKEALYDEAVNFVLQKAYDQAAKESKLDIVSRPEIDVEEVSAEDGVIFTALVYVKPEVKITDFKGISYKPFNLEVTDEDIDNELKEVLEKNSRVITVTDRAIKLDDIVTLDFDGSIDGVRFEGGQGKDFDLTIGSKTFIDTFEEQLIGCSLGDDVVVKVTFPDDYHAEELKGKEAEFKVEIKDIKMKEMPNLDDDFAQDVSEFDTLSEYKDSIIEKIKEVKLKDAKADKEDQVMNVLIERAEIELPQVMVENHVEQLVEDFAARLRQQGMNLDMYLQYMGQTIDDMREVYRSNAEVQVRGRLILEKIAEISQFEINEDEIKEELERIAMQYNMEASVLESSMREDDKENLKADLKTHKALKFIMESAVEEK